MALPTLLPPAAEWCCVSLWEDVTGHSIRVLRETGAGNVYQQRQALGTDFFALQVDGGWPRAASQASLVLGLGCSSRYPRGKGNELNPSSDTFVLILSLSCCLLTGDGWLIMRPAQYITFPIQGLLNHFKFSNSLINILSVAEESGTGPFLKTEGSERVCMRACTWM